MRTCRYVKRNVVFRKISMGIADILCVYRTGHMWPLFLLFLFPLIPAMNTYADDYRIIVRAVDMPESIVDEVESRANEKMKLTVDYLGHSPSGSYTIYITGDSSEFRRYAGNGIPDWAVAVYSRRTIVIKPEGLNTNPENFYNIIHHELVHAVLDYEFRKHPDALPRWLNEGIAVNLSEAWEIPSMWNDRKTRLYNALRQGNVADFDDIARGFPRSEILAQTAYAQSADFTQYLMKRRGKPSFRRLLELLAAGTSTDSAFNKIYGAPLDELADIWRRHLDRPGAWVIARHVLAYFDMYTWVAMGFLFLAVYFIVISRRKRIARLEADDDEYDPDDDWDDLDEEWDPDVYGDRPWRPGRRH